MIPARAASMAASTIRGEIEPPRVHLKGSNPKRVIYEGDEYRVIVEHRANPLGRFAVSIHGKDWAMASSVEHPSHAQAMIDEMLEEHDSRRVEVAKIQQKSWRK